MKLTKMFRFRSWWSAVALSDAAENNHNMGAHAQLQFLRRTTAAKIFWKIYLLYDSWCVQTCSFRAIFGLPLQNLTFTVSDI